MTDDDTLTGRFAALKRMIFMQETPGDCARALDAIEAEVSTASADMRDLAQSKHEAMIAARDQRDDADATVKALRGQLAAMAEPRERHHFHSSEPHGFSASYTVGTPCPGANETYVNDGSRSGKRFHSNGAADESEPPIGYDVRGPYPDGRWMAFSGRRVDGLPVWMDWEPSRPEAVAACWAAYRAATPAPDPTPAYVCETCRDTHAIERGGWVGMCARCPTPCQKCRSGGTGPYCAATPCACECHVKPAPEPTPDRVRRPSPLSPEAHAARYAPPPPASLVDALQDRIHVDSGRLLSASPVFRDVPQTTLEAPDLPWILTMICCGKDDGVQRFGTWAEANALRESYCNPAGTTHERSAVISRDIPHIAVDLSGALRSMTESASEEAMRGVRIGDDSPTLESQLAEAERAWWDASVRSPGYSAKSANVRRIKAAIAARDGKAKGGAK